MPANRLRLALLAALATVLLASVASAQLVTFPRVGLSAAPDRYEPYMDVHGLDPFQVYVIVLPPEGEPLLAHDYQSFHWALLEACCGGAATLVAEDYNPACEHDGSVYVGVTTTAPECMGGEAILLCTLTLQMSQDVTGTYYVIGGPLSQSYTCEGDPVVMTDMTVYVNYTSDTAPVEASTLSEVKGLFLD